MYPASPLVFAEEEPCITEGLSSNDDSFFEIQPGLIVALSTSEGLRADRMESSFPGDSEYIHLNCLLHGRFEARVKDVALNCASGDLHMGFSDGEVFHAQNFEQFSNLDLMATPQMLHKLAGEELAGISFDKEISFFIKQGYQCQRVTASATRIVSLMRQKSQQSLLLHSAILDYLYWHLTAQQADKTRENLSCREKKQLAVAKEYLLSDLSSPPTIAVLARAVGLNECKLKKGFKTLFGSSIYACFQKKRMHLAMQLLKNHNVTETAMILGYSNISHFSTAFRKQLGILPKQARRELVPDFSKFRSSE